MWAWATGWGVGGRGTRQNARAGEKEKSVLEGCGCGAPPRQLETSRGGGYWADPGDLEGASTLETVAICIKNEGICIESEELCSINEGFCI